MPSPFCCFLAVGLESTPLITELSGGEVRRAWPDLYLKSPLMALPSKSALELPKGTMPAADSARLRAALVIPTPQFGVPFPLGWGRCFLHPYLPFSGASQMALVVKNPSASAGDIRDSGLIPRWRISPGGGHGNPLSILAWRIPQRSLVGYRSWGCKELDKTEAT